MDEPQEEDLEQQIPSSSDPGQHVSRPSLLPAFEPVSSSPNPTRTSKRKYAETLGESRSDFKYYPTPVPTSSTGLATSSPPPQIPPLTRPGLKRTTSTASERVPLGTVPSIQLPLNGEPILMGRSSNSSHFQLSNCRLISRVHISVAYRATSESHEYGEVVVECLGWNGAKIHCEGKAYDLGKGHTFSSDKPQAEIMLDVQDARVLIKWPDVERKGSESGVSEASWEELGHSRRRETPENEHFASSPPQARAFLNSPVSPSPNERNHLTTSSAFLGLPSTDSAPVEVYEDHASEGEEESAPPSAQPVGEAATFESNAASQASSLSEPQEFSDHDEENDPIVHSFGPFGANLLPRMASINAGTPERHREPLKASVSPRQKTESGVSVEPDLSPVRNHAVNQLAFSRLHALPLSTIMNNLPSTLKDNISGRKESTSEPVALTAEVLKKLLEDAACVGRITREGKDAAGKQLEDEFYYVPEVDTNEMRRSAVENSLGKSTLRSVRKQHKQYYWKRPRH